MNIENFEKLRGLIASLPEEACDMSLWCVPADGVARDKVTSHHTCGTTACLGGWTNAIQRSEGQQIPHYDGGAAGDWLGLNAEQQHELFYEFPDNSPAQGWKQWMLGRIDACIEAQDVPMLAPTYPDDEDDYDEDE